MSRFAKIANLIAKSEFLTKNLFSFFTQLVIYSKSSNYIKFQETLIEKLGVGLIGAMNGVEKAKVFEGLKLLRPDRFSSELFIRIGPKSDGGYVIFNDINEIKQVVSIGVAKDTAFEEHLNELNPRITFDLFDHTDQPVRILPKNFNFHNLGLAKQSQGDKISLEEIFLNYVKFPENLILKIDIEGFEYESLNINNISTLKNVKQVLIEFHNINNLTLKSEKFSEILSELRKYFYLAHIHGNNNDSWINLYGAVIPQTLEVTFINKTFAMYQQNEIVIFPREMDYPCRPGNEMLLGAFIFPTFQ